MEDVILNDSNITTWTSFQVVILMPPKLSANLTVQKPSFAPRMRSLCSESLGMFSHCSDFGHCIGVNEC